MAADARGPAGQDGTSDDSADDAPERTLHDPPPPCVLDLGNGEVFAVGTAAGLRAAADWLERNYPDGSQGERYGPVFGPVLNMSNYRVRQVLGLGPMPERQLRLLIALATWMGDDTRTVRVGFEALITESGKSHNTVRNARRELEADGKLTSERGDGRGHVTLWTALCLPEKGTNEIGTLNGESKGTNDIGTLTPAGKPRKGTNYEPERVPTEGAKGYQSERADQREPERGLNRIANPLGSISLSAHASDVDGNDERETDDFDDDDEEELDPDFVFLAGAVPGADWRDVENAITSLQYRKHHGEIHVSVRAYLRKIIENGDARSLVDEAAAERRRGEIELARHGDPFGSDPWAPAAANGTRVVAGEVIHPDAGIWLTGTPETRTPAPAYEPAEPPWKQVECPVCKAPPERFCTNPATGSTAATHHERRLAAGKRLAEEASQ